VKVGEGYGHQQLCMPILSDIVKRLPIQVKLRRSLHEHRTTTCGIKAVERKRLIVERGARVHRRYWPALKIVDAGSIELPALDLSVDMQDRCVHVATPITKTAGSPPMGAIRRLNAI